MLLYDDVIFTQTHTLQLIQLIYFSLFNIIGAAMSERLAQRTSFHLFTTFHLITAFHLFSSFHTDNTASSVLLHKILTILHFFHLQLKRWVAVAICFGPSFYLYCWCWEHGHNVFGRRLNVPASLLMVHWGLQQPSLLPVFMADTVTLSLTAMDIFCPHCL